MTFSEIQELFIAGALTDRRLPNTARPKQLKSQSLPFVHSWEDLNGWDAKDKEARNWEWLDPAQLRLTTKDVSDWELTMKLIVLVDDEKNRRCLFAWSRAEAGGKAFNAWCKAEGIHRNTGARRKDRAIMQIEASLTRNVLFNNDNVQYEVLPEEQLLCDKLDKLAKRAWRDEEAQLTRDNIISGWRGIKAARNAERRAKR
jgi:hypothetical protein